MNATKRFIVLTLCVLFLYNFPGCQLIDASYLEIQVEDEVDSIDNIQKEAEKEDEPLYGGSINIPMLREDNHLPLITSSKDIINISGLIYEGLIELDDELKPAPALAESWSVSDDGKVWTFKLRHGIKWHDGMSFSIEDVLFTIDVLRHGGFDSYYAKKFNRVNGIQVIKGIGQNTLYIELDEPVSYLLESLAFPIIPRHVFGYVEETLEEQDDEQDETADDQIGDSEEELEDEDETDEDNKTDIQYIKLHNMMPIGTGPYKVEPGSYKPYEEFSLVRDNSYWGDKPYIDRIRVKVYDDASHIMKAFNKGEIDVFDTNVVFVDSYIEHSKAKRTRYLTSTYEFLAINHNNPIFNDINIRKALAFGIDRKDIIKTIYLNNAEAIDTPISPDSWLFDANTRIYDRDVDRAIELLEGAGWKYLNEEGIREKTIDGERVELRFKLVTNMENDPRKDAAEAIRRQLSNSRDGLGIYIEVEIVEWDKIVGEIIPNKDFDLLLIGHHMPEMPDLEFLFGSEGEYNFLGYESSILDELILESRHLISEDHIRQAYKDIQNHFVENIPTISLYYPTNSILTSAKIRGKKLPRDLNIYKNIEDWYVNYKK
ncbi:MAG: peptide ABC transporter substrate-binding protein [Clostridiales bacterium]|nr:peptide ABC transporter substrate-binding protein [Clostridiales bacterium]